jgi:amino acid adenylation domain-containing protein
MDVAERFDRTFARCADLPAICLTGVVHSYRELAGRVTAIQAMLVASAGPDERLIGVVATDSLDTYASVLAVLRSGRAFVPLNPEHPSERNASIIKQAELRTVLSPIEDFAPGPSHSYTLLLSARAATAPGSAPGRDGHPGRGAATPADLAYLLFTSGSTGEPKGVPITRGNLEAFLDALALAGCGMDENDRVLQMFDLTFDFSIASYLAPLASGACVFTVPSSGVKFAEVYRLLDEERLTVAPLVPSVLTYLRPYFDEIRLPDLRLAFFCGEALHADVVSAFRRCVPKADIVNFYGPTEATVFALVYAWRPEDGKDKTLNGVVSIGRPMAEMQALIVDEDGEPLPRGEKGNLALAGPQVTPGFWKDEERNARAFFERVTNGRPERYLRTGDLAVEDQDGDFLFCGRFDQQIKVQGFRVELGEIEHHARALVPGHECVVVRRTTPAGAAELELCVEAYRGDLKAILSSLRDRVPSYMVPVRAFTFDRLPLNANGKIDRRRLEVELEALHG